MSTALVLTPGGHRSQNLVYRVTSGQVLDFFNDRPRIKSLTSEEVIDVPPAEPDAQRPEFGKGWIAYGAWANASGSPITDFETRWKVPAIPSSASGQTIFLFNGIDPKETGAAILQPVLQWGESAAGGGPYWAVASWYVLGTGHAFHTDLVRVSPGDDLLGVMKLAGSSNGSFSYSVEFMGIPGTTLAIKNVAELVWCNQTLEAYQISKCSDYPNVDHTSMNGIRIQIAGRDVEPVWVSNVTATEWLYVVSCGTRQSHLARACANG